MIALPDTLPFPRARQAAHNSRVALQEVFRVWRSAVLGALGILAVAAVTFVAARLHADSATAALLFLFVIVIFSLSARLVPALIVSVVAISCLDFFFTPPLYRVRISETLDVVAFVVFSTTALVVTR